MTLRSIEGRTIAFTARFGSHNYNLNDKDSDMDRKHFTIPTFDDLYTGKFFSTSKVGAAEDYDSHDIRKMSELFWKANINFLEVLYSEDVAIYHPGIQPIIDMRDFVVTMNLPYFFSACHGMHHQKMKQLKKGTEGTQHLVDQFGYDTKQASHAYRVLDFIIRFWATGWDFSRSIKYADHSYTRLHIMNIKRGKFTEEEFRKDVAKHYNKFMELEHVYKAYTPNTAIKDRLDQHIKDLVHSSVCGVAMP